MIFSADYPYRQWECGECKLSPQTHAQRGRCGGAFGPGTPDAKRDAAGRWWLPVEATCKGTGGSAVVADLRLYRCPVALARQVWASPVPALYAGAQHGAPTTPYGVGELSHGGAAAVRELGAAWSWRRDLEADHARQVREANAKGGRGG